MIHACDMATRSLLLPLAVVLAVAAPVHARASCPACSTGAASLGAPGEETPFDGRVRLGATISSREVAYGAVQLHELRSDLLASWAPIAPLVLSIDAPLVWRRGSDGTDTNGLGNVQVTARWIVVRDRRLAPSHLFSVVAGALLPSPSVNGASATLSYLATAPGATNGGMTAGLAYVGRYRDVAVSATCTGAVWLDGPGLVRLGPVAMATLAVQWEVSSAVAVRLGTDVRYNARSRGALGQVDTDSGGLVLAAGPDLLFTIDDRALVTFGVRFPVADLDTGVRREGISLAASATVDL